LSIEYVIMILTVKSKGIRLSQLFFPSRNESFTYFRATTSDAVLIKPLVPQQQ